MLVHTIGIKRKNSNWTTSCVSNGMLAGKGGDSVLQGVFTALDYDPKMLRKINR